MTWSIGWCPWNDPVSRAQEQTEEGLRWDDKWLCDERIAPEPEKEETDDGHK